jgi:hypothetical protein
MHIKATAGKQDSGHDGAAAVKAAPAARRFAVHEP